MAAVLEEIVAGQEEIAVQVQLPELERDGEEIGGGSEEGRGRM